MPSLHEGFEIMLTTPLSTLILFFIDFEILLWTEGTPRILENNFTVGESHTGPYQDGEDPEAA